MGRLRAGLERESGYSRQIDGRVASEDYASEAPTDPGMRIFRIRLFGSRFRYAASAERM